MRQRAPTSNFTGRRAAVDLGPNNDFINRLLLVRPAQQNELKFFAERFVLSIQPKAAMTASELTEKAGAIDLELASIKADVTSIKTSIPTTVDDLSRLKQRLDDILKAAEEAQRKADSEAHRAFLAKEICEQHAKATTDQKGLAEAAASAAAGFKANADENLRGISGLKAQAEEATKAATDARDVASKAQEALIKVQPQLELDAKAITEQRAGGDAFIEELRKAQSAAKVNSDEIATQKITSVSLTESINQSKLASEELIKKATENSIGIEKLRNESEQSKQTVAQLVQDLEKRNEEIVKYKVDLGQMNQEYKALGKRIDGLLPLAASASLASAFRTQKKRFFWPQIIWLSIFIITILALVYVAIPESGSAELKSIFGHQLTAQSDLPTRETTWDDILLQMARRLPLIIPLAWLAIFAGRNYGLAARLEEDYAFKEAVSTAFEGYKREMTEMTKSGGEKGSPLDTLCQNILNAISQRPGRIYDGKHQDVTPLTPMSNAIRDLREREVS